MSTRVEMIIETLRVFPEQKFSAKELAELFVERYPVEMAKKQQNPRYADYDALITQLCAEIGGERTVEAKKRCPQIHTRDKPRPRLYYWQECDALDDSELDMAVPVVSSAVDTSTENSATNSDATQKPMLEHELYPMLIDYLHNELGLLCLRIDEKRSHNRFGKGGNHWLHPDIVAMQPLIEHWHKHVQACVRSGNDKSTRLWSFEVKKQLTRANVRQCFFQAVSNSS